MIFKDTGLAGVVQIEMDPHWDERGHFARTWCENEFREKGLNPRIAQCNISFNRRKGTLRGLHYQAAPFQEAKLVRCSRGSLYDVVVDLRPHSETFMNWVGSELTATNLQALYIPEGCAHGFLTLENETEVHYQISEFYHPETARGVRWNDPAFKICWPGRVEVISDRDRGYLDFEPI
jgi:dTDP-4-dehydrorhamnose 3,5-epimerase